MTARRVLASLFDVALLLSLTASLPRYIFLEQAYIRMELIGFAVYLGVFTVYCAVFLAVSGATPGKMLFGLRVRKPDGTKISFWQALVRSFLSIIVSWVAGPSHKASVFLRADRRHWLDLLVGTQVVNKKGPPAPAAPIRKILAWTLILGFSLVVIANHTTTLMRNVRIENSNLIFVP